MPDRDEVIYDPKLAQNPTHGLIIAAVAAIFLFGGIAGGLYYAWEISPVVEQDIRPDQLRAEDEIAYVSGIALDYRYLQTQVPNYDGNRTYNLLLEVDPSRDPYQLAADTVCEMIRLGQYQTSADIAIIRSLIDFFSTQSTIAVGCDIQVFAVSDAPTLTISTPVPTVLIETPVPVFTKTPTQPFSVPTDVPDTNDQPTPVSGEFRIIQTSQFCSPNSSGVIEIRVRRANFGDGIPGIPVEVQWNTPNGQLSQRFFTGLKPDRDPGYADFVMEQGFSYQVRLQGLSGFTDRLEAVPCDDEGTLRSYQIIFQSS